MLVNFIDKYWVIMIKLNKYTSYSEYCKHQKSKALLENVLEDHKLKWNDRVDYFINEFKDLNLPNKSNVLCIASRYGEEVEALKKLNHNAIGIDLIEFKPYTIKMDMHKLEFEDGSFDVVYTNAIDHSYDIKKCIKEMIRVLKEEGTIIIKIELNNNNTYETYVFNSEEDITNILKRLVKDYEFESFISKGEGKCIWHGLIYKQVIK